MRTAALALLLTACTSVTPSSDASDVVDATSAQDIIDAPDAATDAGIDAPEAASDVVTDVTPQDCYMGWVCNGACKNLLIDLEHCGGCNYPCPSGAMCMQGACFCDGSLCR